MSIKAIAKKRIGLRHEKQIIVLEPLAYTELPDAVQSDPMFAWAKGAGVLQVIGDDTPAKKKTVKKDKAAETTEAVPTEAEK